MFHVCERTALHALTVEIVERNGLQLFRNGGECDPGYEVRLIPICHRRVFVVPQRT